VRRSYKFRLYPNANQLRELDVTLESHRRLYNECLDYRMMAWETCGATVTAFDQSRWFTHERTRNAFYGRLESRSARETIRRLDKAYAAFFRRVKNGNGAPGFPRFKGKNRFDSFDFNGLGHGFGFKNGKLRLFGIGLVRIKQHREMEGTIKAVSIKREGGKWYAIFSCDLGDVAVEPSQNPPIGIDVGIESFATTSNGEHEPSPAFHKKSLPELKRANRAVARKKRGGKNRRKAVKRLQKVHAKVKNSRRDHHHKYALSLVRRYGLVAVESLNIQGMVRNRRLARAIQDAGWYGFLTILKCKAEIAGVQYVEVNARNTSQECSQCGERVEKTLSQRWHKCSCGCSLHRDVNAARNILVRSLVWAEPAGRNGGVTRHVLKSRQLTMFG
jgi:putative transposase